MTRDTSSTPYTPNKSTTSIGKEEEEEEEEEVKIRKNQRIREQKLRRVNLFGKG
jgi:hypothetical protein